MTNSTVISLLKKAIEARQELFDDAHESAFRLFSGFTEGYRELVVDIYGKTLVIHDYAEQPEQPIVSEVIGYLQQTLSWLRAGIVKSRNGKTQEDKRGHIVFGDKLDDKIKEHGIWYAINLTMNRDMSFYLDTYHLRKWLLDNMSGKSVLNAFAYTGSFGVAALAGGASKVMQLDRNKRFLNLAKTSYALNALPENNNDFIAQDFFPALSRFKTAKRLFDCVIIDPPFFSTTSKGKIDQASESKRLINKVRPLIKDGGTLIAVNNALYLSGKEYMNTLEELCKDGYLSITELIPVPDHFVGYNNKSAPVTDPSPFNHSTKIAILDVKKK